MGALHLHPVPSGVRLHHLNLRSSPGSLLLVTLFPFNYPAPPTFPFPPLRLRVAPIAHISSASLGRCASLSVSPSKLPALGVWPRLFTAAWCGHPA